MLIQLIFWFNAVPIMFPHDRIGMPFTDIVLVSEPMTQLVTPCSRRCWA